MPDAIVAQELKLLGGKATIGMRPDSGPSVTIDDSSIGGEVRTAVLGAASLEQLRKTIIHAQYGMDEHAGGDGVYRVISGAGPDRRILVSLRPVEGAYVTDTGKRINSVDAPEAADSEVYSAEYDMVIGEGNHSDFDDEPQTRVSLADLEGRKGIYETALRASLARRVVAGGSVVDVYSPRPSAVALRTLGDDGQPTEVLLNARDYRRLDAAMSSVIWGDNESDEHLQQHESVRVVDTAAGPVEVAFAGRRDDHRFTDSSSLAITPKYQALWRIVVSGPDIEDFQDAFDRNGDAVGVERAHRSSRVRADWNPADHPRNPHSGEFIDKHGPLIGKVVDVADKAAAAWGALEWASDAGLLKPANLRAMSQATRIKQIAPEAVETLGPAAKVAGHAFTGVSAVLDAYSAHKSWGHDWGQVTFSAASLGLTAGALFFPPAALVLGSAGLGLGMLSHSDKVRERVGNFTAPAWSAVDRGARKVHAHLNGPPLKVGRRREPPRTTAQAALKLATAT